MPSALRSRFVLCAAVIAGVALPAMSASAQQPYGPNDAPNLYKFNYGWAQLPDRRNSARWSASTSTETARACGRSTAVSPRPTAPNQISIRS